MQDFSSRTTRDLYDHYVAPTYARFPLTFVRGEGSTIWDEEGKAYLDFGTGIAVCSLGHAHPAVTEALSRQAGRLIHTSNLYHTRPQAELAARLVEITGAPGKIFFCNSGAEANEGLYKLARKFGHPSKRHQIITFQKSFHGRTLGGISATGQDKIREGFGPTVPGFFHATFNDLESVKKLISPETAAVLVEPVQGEGGINIARHEFLLGLRELCDEHNLLLCFDEVQCGLGRTGDWCGWRSISGTSVMPDAVSWAKGIANGVPLGAFWIRDRKLGDDGLLSSVLGPGTHGTTYGGNPLACSAGLAVLETIHRENLLHNTLEQGAYLRHEIENAGWNGVTSVRGIGLMIGMELNPSALPYDSGSCKTAAETASKLAQAGLLTIPSGEKVIRLLPPLNVSGRDCGKALEILGSVLSGK